MSDDIENAMMEFRQLLEQLRSEPGVETMVPLTTLTRIVSIATGRPSHITVEETVRPGDPEWPMTACADLHAAHVSTDVDQAPNPHSGRRLRLMTGEESMAVLEKRIVHQQAHPELYEQARERHEGRGK